MENRFQLKLFFQKMLSLQAGFFLIFAFPASTTYQLKDFGFGSGGVSNSTSTNYAVDAVSGEQSSGDLTGSTYDLGSGLLFRNRVLSDLNIYDPPTDSGMEAWNITARSYANIFRILYNASYLSVKSSNEVLGMLVESKFDKGITAGVPSGTKVAQKFGEANELKDGEEFHILNNCGIVYKPNNPYILCILTEGKEYEDMKKVIERIARYSYDTL